MSNRDKFIKVWEGIIGYPYIWGGESINGFDCSGAVRYCWEQIGYIMPDMTAREMCLNYWKDCRIPDEAAKPGDLRFYGSSPKNINHVMCVFRVWKHGEIVLCGARGGNSKTDEDKEAYKEWALVDICRDSTYWRNNLQYTVNPFLRNNKVIKPTKKETRENKDLKSFIKYMLDFFV